MGERVLKGKVTMTLHEWKTVILGVTRHLPPMSEPETRWLVERKLKQSIPDDVWRKVAFDSLGFVSIAASVPDRRGAL